MSSPVAAGVIPHMHYQWVPVKAYSVDEVKDLIIKDAQPSKYKINFTGASPYSNMRRLLLLLNS